MNEALKHLCSRNYSIFVKYNEISFDDLRVDNDSFTEFWKSNVTTLHN